MKTWHAKIQRQQAPALFLYLKERLVKLRFAGKLLHEKAGQLVDLFEQGTAGVAIAFTFVSALIAYGVKRQVAK